LNWLLQKGINVNFGVGKSLWRMKGSMHKGVIMFIKKVWLCLSLSMACQFVFAQQSPIEARTYGLKDDQELVLKAAEEGNASAQAELGNRFLLAKPPDYDNAVKWFRKAAEQGYARGENGMGICYANGLSVNKDEVEALKWYRKAAEQGYVRAQLWLGLCYETGKGVSKDDVEAFRWYRKAAEQGDPQSQNLLGACYTSGRGVNKDEIEAFKWYRKAADQGIAQAQYNLGLSFAKGSGVGKDEPEALKWYRKAAEQGYVQGQVKLGLCYENGSGVSIDEVEASKWYQKAAEQGHVIAQCMIGARYSEGKGVAKDEAEAVKWFSKAAKKGNPFAQYNLGKSYFDGKGITTDRSEALKWFLKAADQGYASAQAMVALSYEFGNGVTENKDEAIKWYQKAAELGDVTAQEKCKQYKVKWKISAADEIEEVDEKRLGELKAKAEALKSSTVVFKSLYLGMSIQDAAALLRYYMGQGGSVKAPTIVLQNYADGRWFRDEESGIRVTAAADGKVTAIYLPKKAVDIMFDAKGVDVKSFIKTFQSSYSLSDFQRESRPLEFFSHNLVVGKMDGIQPIASKLGIGMQEKWTTTSQQGYSVTVFGAPSVFEERKLRELVLEGTVETIPSGSILVRKINTAAFD
jgi:TPR repeat protein